MTNNNLTKQKTPIKFFNFTKLVVLVFKNLNSAILHNLSNDKPISYDEKHEFIEKLEKIIEGVRNRNIKSLKYEVSKCKFCYPNAPVYKFYDEESGFVVGRYVITETEDQYIFETCKNNPITSDPLTGMPF